MGVCVNKVLGLSSELEGDMSKSIVCDATTNSSNDDVYLSSSFFEGLEELRALCVTYVPISVTSFCAGAALTSSSGFNSPVSFFISFSTIGICQSQSEALDTGAAKAAANKPQF